MDPDACTAVSTAGCACPDVAAYAAEVATPPKIQEPPQGPRTIEMTMHVTQAQLDSLQGGNPVFQDTLLADMHRVTSTQAFQDACREGNMEKVTEMLALTGVDCVLRQKDLDKAFCAGCKEGHLPVVDALLRLEGYNAVNTRAFVGEPLTGACTGGHQDVVKRLLSLTGAQAVDVHDSDDQAFRVACARGHLAVAIDLLALRGPHAVHVSAKDDDALFRASRNGHASIVRLLLNLQDGRRPAPDLCTGPCILKQTSANGHLAVLQALLLAYTDAIWMTPGLLMECLEEACAKGHLDLVRSLMGWNADTPRGIDMSESCFFLQQAARYGHVHILEYFMSLPREHRAYIEPHALNLAWVSACSHGNKDAFLFFLSLEPERGLDVDFQNDGAFMGACRGGHVDIAFHLLKMHTPTSTEDAATRGPPTARQSAALQEACKQGNIGIATMLLCISDSPEMPDKDDYAACAAWQQRRREHGAASVADEDCAAFRYACANGHLATAKRVYAASDPKWGVVCLNAKKGEALRRAAENGHVHVAQYILHQSKREWMASNSAEYDPEDWAPWAPPDGMVDALNLAATNGHLDVVKMLLKEENGISVLTTRDAWHNACREGHVSMVQFLLGRPNAWAAYKISLSRSLHLASDNGHCSVVTALFEHAGHDLRQSHVQDCFEHACSNGKDKLVSMLLSRWGENSVQLSQDSAQTAFFMACSRGYVSIVQAVLSVATEHGFAVDYNNHVSLKTACKAGHAKVAEAILDFAAHNTGMFTEDFEWCLTQACSQGHLHVAKVLMASSFGGSCNPLGGNDVNFVLACANGHADVALFITAHAKQAGFECSTRSQTKALRMACRNGHLQVVKQLTNGNQLFAAEMECRPGDMTAMHLACVQGHPKVVSQLLTFVEKGPDSHAFLFEGKDSSPFHYACKGGHVGIVNRLLTHGGVDVADASPQLMCDYFVQSCEHGHVDILSLFMQKKLMKRSTLESKHAPQFRGFDLACINGHISVVNYMLDRLPEKQKIGRVDCNLFEKVCANGHVDVVKRLVESDLVNIHARNEAAFLAACRHGHIDIVDYLLGIKGDDAIGKGLDAFIMNQKQELAWEQEENPDAFYDFDDECYWWKNAVQEACIGGHIRVVTRLHAPDVTQDNAFNYSFCMEDYCLFADKVLENVCKHGNIDVLECLIDNGWDFGPTLSYYIYRHHGQLSTYFRYACAAGHVGIVKKLLSWELEGWMPKPRQPHYMNTCLPPYTGESTAGYPMYFEEACANGHLNVIEVLLYPKDVMPGKYVCRGLLHSGLRRAVENGHAHVVQYLLALQHSRGEAAMEVNGPRDGFLGKFDDQTIPEYMFRVACEKGYLDIVDMFLAFEGTQYVNVHAGDDWAIRTACLNGHIAVAHRLLSLTGDRAVCVGACDHYAFRMACAHNQAAMVEDMLLWTGPHRVDVHAGNGQGFKAACDSGHERIVRILLGLRGDRSMDVYLKTDGFFEGVFRNGRVAIARILMQLPSERSISVRVQSASIVAICKSGNLDMLHMLLDMPAPNRVDFSACRYDAFRTACWNGHVSIVRTLLALTDPDRVIVMSQVEHDAFHAACTAGHAAVVTELLDLRGDRRIEKTRTINAGFNAASSKQHVQIVKMLLQLKDGRQPDPDVVAARACRRSMYG